jgi:Iap family predicted aminopeptidase
MQRSEERQRRARGIASRAMRALRPTVVTLLSLLAAPAGAESLVHPSESRLAEVRQLTHGGENAEAYWSFDGRRLSFQSTRPPHACDQIYILDPFAPGEPESVSSGAGRTTCAHFLLGDRRILWSGTDAYASGCPAPPDRSQGYVWPVDPDYEIFVADLDGANRARWTENRAYDAEATVCAQDGSIVFTSTRDGDLDLYRMDADGSNVRRLTSTPGYDGGAFFSADCTKLVWRASRPQGAELEEYRALLARNLVRPSRLEIWVANADGSEARQVTDLGAASFAPFFFPSGERILFSSNYGDPRGREFDLWAIDADGTDLERVTFTPGFDGFPMFAPDGRHLVFASNRNQGRPGETDLYLARWVDGPAAATVERAADRFAADVAWLADDAREGRGIGTAGLAAAGEWIEARFRELGLAPAGSEGARQAFEVEVAVRAGPGTRLEIDGAGVAADAFVPAPFSTAGPVEAEVVAAGWGITAPDKGYDDYAGLDVRGRIVLVRRFVPPGGAFSGTEDERRWGDLRYKAFNAREHGAVAVLVADLEPVGGVDPNDPHSGAEAPLPKLRPTDGADAGLPVVVAKREAVAGLADGGRARIEVDLAREHAPAFNVVGRLDPAGTPVDDRLVVIGAHYDHLGFGGSGSLEPDSTAVHNGADDNASGVAALLEAGRTLAARRSELLRPVVFVAFAGEERGLLGSARLVKSPPAGFAVERVLAMINLDMVGRLRGQTVTVFGTDTAVEWGAVLPAACARAGIECKSTGDGYGPSDHTSFYAAGAPVLFLFTGTHDQYHRPSDDAATLNATGGARVAALTADLALGLAAREGALAYQRTTAPAPQGDVRSFGASLGTIPDYAGPGEGKSGMLLAGVRPGGPADKAGLRRGDILVGLSGKEIRGVEDLMFVLRQSHPGEATTVVYEREGARHETAIVFGEAARRN